MTYDELIKEYPMLAPLASTSQHQVCLIMLAYHAGRADGIDAALKITRKDSKNVKA